jgi:hypothetical protein
MLEMGPRQRSGVRAAVAASGLTEVHRGLDHAGLERVLVLRKA